MSATEQWCEPVQSLTAFIDETREQGLCGPDFRNETARTIRVVRSTGRRAILVWKTSSSPGTSKAAGRVAACPRTPMSAKPTSAVRVCRSAAPTVATGAWISPVLRKTDTFKHLARPDPGTRRRLDADLVRGCPAALQ